MQTINQCWHQPPGQTRSPPSGTTPALHFDLASAWNRIRAGMVLYRGIPTPFPAYLWFSRFEMLNGGDNAAIFELTFGERQLQVWVVPDRVSGEPRVVRAKGGIDKATDVSFIDPIQNSNAAIALPSLAPTHEGGGATNVNPQQQRALLHAFTQSAQQRALPPRSHSMSDWSRASRVQIWLKVPELGGGMPMKYVGEGKLLSGRPVLVFETFVYRRYRCMVAPSDRNGDPIVVTADSPDERSQFTLVE